MEMQKTIEYLEEKSKNIAVYSDKLRQSLKDIDNGLTDVFSQASIAFSDSEVLTTLTTPYGITYYRLCIAKAYVNKSDTNTAWGMFIADTDDEFVESPKWIGYASRDMLKCVVKRLPEFLSLYAEMLKGTEEEYRKISDIAEEMVKIVVTQ